MASSPASPSPPPKSASQAAPRLQIAQVLADLNDLAIAVRPLRSATPPPTPLSTAANISQDPTAAITLISSHSPLLCATQPRRASRAPLAIPDAPAVAREKRRGAEAVEEDVGREDEDMGRARTLLKLLEGRERVMGAGAGAVVEGLESARADVREVERRFGGRRVEGVGR